MTDITRAITPVMPEVTIAATAKAGAASIAAADTNRRRTTAAEFDTAASAVMARATIAATAKAGAASIAADTNRRRTTAADTNRRRTTAADTNRRRTTAATIDKPAIAAMDRVITSAPRVTIAATAKVVAASIAEDIGRSLTTMELGTKVIMAVARGTTTATASARVTTASTAGIVRHGAKTGRDAAPETHGKSPIWA